MSTTPPEPEAPTIRRLAPEDAGALYRFYNGLSPHSKRLFRPLGPQTDEERCRLIAEANRPASDTKYDLVARRGPLVVGWAFLWHDATKPGEASLGLGVADDAQGAGLGSALLDALLDAAPARGLRRIRLTVVQDNTVAQRLYASRGFVCTGSVVGGDGLDYFAMAREVE